jgi:hypothetical protein
MTINKNNYIIYKWIVFWIEFNIYINYGKSFKNKKKKNFYIDFTDI